MLQHLPSILQRFNYLKYLQLAAENMRYSFHWAVGIVSQHCSKLEGLTIAYNWTSAESDNEDTERITSLVMCRNLRTLVLMHFGSRSEFDDVQTLLKELPHLEYLYHKELSNVLTHICRSQKLNSNTSSLGSLAPSPKNLLNTENRTAYDSTEQPCIQTNLYKSDSVDFSVDSFPGTSPNLCDQGSNQYSRLTRLDNYRCFGDWYSQRVYSCPEGERDVQELCPQIQAISLVAPRDLGATLRAWKIKKLTILQVKQPL